MMLAIFGYHALVHLFTCSQTFVNYLAYVYYDYSVV